MIASHHVKSEDNTTPEKKYVYQTDNLDKILLNASDVELNNASDVELKNASDVELKKYILFSYASLAEDILAGHGEYLDSLYMSLGIPYEENEDKTIKFPQRCFDRTKKFNTIF